MVDLNIKKFAIEMALEADVTPCPGILISPVFTPTPDEWKRILYTFLSAQQEIRQKTNICFTTRIINITDIPTQEKL